MLRKVLLALIVVGAAGALAWRLWAPDPVERAAALTGNPEQEQLWRAASSPHAAAAVERLAALQPSGPVPPLSPAPQQKPQPGAIPSKVMSTIRIVSDLGAGGSEFAGKALVVQVDGNGERILLQLAPKRQLAIVAKVGGKPLGVSQKEAVDVQLRWRPGRIEREQFIAVRTPAGVEIASLVRTGRERVTLKAPLLSGGMLTATQSLGIPLNDALSIEVDGPGFKDTLQPGMEKPYGERVIRVVASVARPAGGNDGAAYGIELITWRFK